MRLPRAPLASQNLAHDRASSGLEGYSTDGLFRPQRTADACQGTDSAAVAAATEVDGLIQGESPLAS
jgi:hypothetical protein